MHLLAGPPGSPRAVTSDQTDVGGVYSISTRVEPSDCNDLQVWVLETSTFDASAQPLAESLLGSCGTFTDLDFVVPVDPPVPAVGAGAQ